MKNKVLFQIIGGGGDFPYSSLRDSAKQNRGNLPCDFNIPYNSTKSPL